MESRTCVRVCVVFKDSPPRLALLPTCGAAVFRAVSKTNFPDFLFRAKNVD